MPKTINSTYRQSCRRSHRLLGMYLAMTAWAKRVDCIVLERPELLPFLGLERMKNKRIDWLKTDVRSLFPYAEALVEVKTKQYSSLFLSRIPFEDRCFEEFMSDMMRIARLKEDGIHAAIVDIPPEKDMIALLAIASAGVRLFKPWERK